ncbi:glycosyltransferase family 87 protein [Halomarina salina]|uniref:Glycosyltransferase family 87 protein n=1 Tax=Halomarina salina TaxID=1872699 RepID=A0ABD5RR67_9EURY|nr:glycosyltransferase family 87 protein [Halomarina salina]
MDRRTAPRLVLALGILVGLVPFARALFLEPWRFGYNYRVYHYTARAVLDGQPMYGVGYSAVDSFHYLYPPITVVGFAALSSLGELGGYLLHTAGTVAVGVALAWLVVRYVDGSPRQGGEDSDGGSTPATDAARPTALDGALVAGYVLCSVHAMPSLLYGQVNVHITAALALGVVWLEHDRGWASGTAFALAAFLKVFPALVGVWLLRRRAWRGVVAAVATALAGFGLGLLAFGADTTREYVDEVLLGQTRSAAFVGGIGPDAAYTTLLRPVSVLVPSLDPALMSVLALLLVAPVVAVTYRRLETRLDRLVAVYVTFVGMLLVVPAYPIYYVYTFFPQVALCYLLTGRARTLFLVGVAVTNVPLELSHLREYGPGLLGDGAQVLLTLLDGPLTLASVHLYGVLVTLLACLVYERERAERG